AFLGSAFAMRAMIGAVPRITVCLPTYNERENLERMLRALREVLPEDGGVLVVDDGSPDGTGELADRLAGEIPNVSVLHRERKEGVRAGHLARGPKGVPQRAPTR